MANDAKILVDGFEVDTVTATIDISNRALQTLLFHKRMIPILLLKEVKLMSLI